jgi:hypothetical protein
MRRQGCRSGKLKRRQGLKLWGGKEETQIAGRREV